MFVDSMRLRTFANLFQAMAAMNRGLNLPSIQRIMNEFERESSAMDMKEEMMADAVDDVMDDEAEDEEEEGDKILKEVLDEIGVGLQQQVSAKSSPTIRNEDLTSRIAGRDTVLHCQCKCTTRQSTTSSCGWRKRWVFAWSCTHQWQAR